MIVTAGERSTWCPIPSSRWSAQYAGIFSVMIKAYGVEEARGEEAGGAQKRCARHNRRFNIASWFRGGNTLVRASHFRRGCLNQLWRFSSSPA